MRNFLIAPNKQPEAPSYDRAQRRRALAEALIGQIGAPADIGQGLSALGKALGARKLNKKADATEVKLDEQWQSQIAGMDIDPARAAIFSSLPYNQRNPALLGHMDRQDAERRAAARAGAASARRAQEEADKERQRAAIAAALMPQTQQRPGVQMGPTVDAAAAGAQSGADLGHLQTEQVQRSPREMLTQMLAGGVDPAAAIGVVGDYQGVMPEEPDLPSSVREYQFYADQEAAAGRDPLSYGDWSLADEKAANPNTGAIPFEPVGTQGFATRLNEETGIPEGFIISNSPLDMERQQQQREAEEKAQAEERAAATQADTETTRRDVVVQTAQDLRKMIDGGGSGGGNILSGDLPEVGVLGSRLAGVNQEASDVGGMIDTLRGMVVFDRLEKLRQASATGASGLGQVTEREIALLGAQLGALDQSLSAPRILQTLDTIEGVFGKLSPAAKAYLMGQSDTLTQAGTATPEAPKAPVRLKFNPETGELE